MADAITAGAFARHFEALVADSLRGTDPRAAPEHIAQYIATQFQAAGLKPAGDSGSWWRRVPLFAGRRTDLVASRLIVAGRAANGGKPIVNEGGGRVEQMVTIRFTTAAAFAADTVLDFRAPGAAGSGQGDLVGLSLVGPPPVIVAGPHTPATVRQAALHDRIVFYLPALEADTVTRQTITALLQASNHVVTLFNEDSARFAKRVAAAAAPIFVPRYREAAWQRRRWAVVARATALRPVLAFAGIDPAAVWAATAPIIHPLLGSAVVLVPVERLQDSLASPVVPNIIGLVPGTDPQRAVIVTAPLTVEGGAELIALAHAFAQRAQGGHPPQASLLFAAVGGGAPEFVGSRVVAADWQDQVYLLGHVMLGRLRPRTSAMNGGDDSVWVVGLSDATWPVQPARLAILHPELRLTVVDSGTAVAPASALLAFARRGIPSLYVHADTIGGVATPPSEEVAARVLRFVAYICDALARAAQTPEWTASGREQRRLVGAEDNAAIGR